MTLKFVLDSEKVVVPLIDTENEEQQQALKESW